MKTRLLVPLFLLAFIIASPQAEAQSKRSERKLKREMRKLEKQMKKVKELKYDFSFPAEFELPELRELDEVREIQHEKALDMRLMQKEMAMQQKEMALQNREMAREQAQHAREMARAYQEEYKHQFKDQHRRVLEETRELKEHQLQELKRIKEHFPDGFEFPDVDFDIPEIHFEDFDFDMPKIHMKNFEFDMPEIAVILEELHEADNSLVITKKLDNESLQKEYSYTVAEDASSLDINVSGSTKSGSINISIKSPDGEEYQSLDISPSADIRWNQRLKLKADEEKSKAGKWTISIDAEEVKGTCSVRMRSK